MIIRSTVSLSTERPDFLAFEITEKITKAIERMADELKPAFKLQGTVDILITIPKWEGIEPGAVLDSKALSAHAQAVKHLRKYAVVGAPVWAKAMIEPLAPLTPVEERTFELEEVDVAWTWISS